MRASIMTRWVRGAGMAALVVGGLAFASGAYAGDHHAHGRHHRPHVHGHPGAHVKHHHHPPRKGWHYHAGRYWAPPSYRGVYCTDARHYHGVHYHVSVRDYYDYYYPRYRYYGPKSLSGVASVIITVPLF
jgi:hypothetical protein